MSAPRPQLDASTSSELAGECAIWPIGADVVGHRIIARRELTGTWSVRLELDVGAIGLVLPAGVSLGLEVGERVDVRATQRTIGMHPVLEGWILRGERVLVASSSSEAPPGWSITRGKAVRASGGRVSFWVHVAHAGGTAVLADGEWRTLAVPNGRFAITARSSAPEPGRPVLPDSTSETRFAIVGL